MADTTKNPFARLDTSLLRSTRNIPAPQAAETPTEPPQDATPPLATRKRVARRQASPSASIEARPIDSNHAGELASTLAYSSDEVVAAIRKVVKTPGREVSFVRLTAGEKADLAELVYTYKRRGYRTTENEINRIAVNFILEDHRRNGAASILTRVLDALMA
jgi:hypothetical protein